MNDTIELLKVAKKQSGLTLKEISEKSGVSLGTVNKLFSGGIASVKVKTAQKLAQVLGVSNSELIKQPQEKASLNKNYGFVRCAALTNEVRIGDVDFNLKTTLELIDSAIKKGVSVAVFPELNLCSYSAGDLITQEALIQASLTGVKRVVEYTKGRNILVFVGFPFKHASRLYNCAAAIFNGEVLAIIPKKNLPNYNEFFERRIFCEAQDEVQFVDFFGKSVPFGYKIILQNTLFSEMRVACEICEDLWVADSLSISHSLCGATIVANLSASTEFAGKDSYRKQMVSMHSSKCLCAYIYSSSGKGESTSFSVYSGHDMICELGEVIAESKPFEDGIAIADVDCGLIEYERIKKFKYKSDNSGYITVNFAMPISDFSLNRQYSKTPFIPENREEREKKLEMVLTIQAHALKKRVEHVNAQKLVLGMSGGLDSTLAMLVCEKTLKLLGKKPSDLVAITMPCFGTSNRTYNNAVSLSKEIKCTLLEINIKESVLAHFKDIGHDPNVADVVYENCQARERTQVLMDYSNMVNGLVVGTGDMSELALGWSTYNGDHMSMYGVNSSVPKTLAQEMVSYFAAKRGGKIGAILRDIVSTPISPELKPTKNGEISQSTEGSVGPYVLNDFYLYHLIGQGFSPSKTFYIAVNTFKNEFKEQTIYDWLYKFIKRFFNSQFKRSCQPSSAKTESLNVSPTEWIMPSDACYTLWLNELESIKGEYNLK